MKAKHVQCDAEVGRPGQYHGCQRRAVGSKQSRFGLWLNYCRKHLGREECHCNRKPSELGHYHSMNSVGMEIRSQSE